MAGDIKMMFFLLWRFPWLALVEHLPSHSDEEEP